VVAFAWEKYSMEKDFIILGDLNASCMRMKIFRIGDDR
jgi:hypothetical protein